MFKTNALDNVANQFVDRNDALLIPGTRLEADDHNIKQIELVDIIESSGQTIKASGDFTPQTPIALTNFASGGAELYEDTGSANVYEIDRKAGSEFALPHVYFDGLKVRFIAGSTNTGISTLQIGSSLSPNSLKSVDSVDLIAGEIVAGDEIEATYSASISAFILNQTVRSRIHVPAIGTALKPFRINRLTVDYATGSYLLPLANSLPDGAWILAELFDMDSQIQPKVIRSGADNIEDVIGVDTEVLYDTGSSTGVRFATNGVDTWEM